MYIGCCLWCSVCCCLFVVCVVVVVCVCCVVRRFWCSLRVTRCVLIAALGLLLVARC